MKKSQSLEPSAIEVTDSASQAEVFNSEVGQILHKVVNAKEVEIQLRKGTAQKETLYMHPIGFIDQMIHAGNLSYVIEETKKSGTHGTQIGNFVAGAVLILSTLWLTLHKRQNGTYVRRFESMEAVGNYLTQSEQLKLYDIFKTNFEVTAEQKKS